MQQSARRARLRWFAPVGRMALTNYMMQSVICTAVFYGYGLGYFEQLPRAWQPLFVVVVFALQVVLGRWWMARYRYDPMEWLWAGSPTASARRCAWRLRDAIGRGDFRP